MDDYKLVSQALASTHVYHGDTFYRVSTIWRRSSAMLNPCLYAETIVFSKDNDLLYTTGSSRRDLALHCEIVHVLFDGGLEGLKKYDPD